MHIYGGIRLKENRRKEKTKIAYLWRNKMHFGGQNVLVTGIDSRAETHRGRPLFFRHIQNHIPIFFNILKIISQYIQNQIPIYSKFYFNIFSSKTIRECCKSREGASLNFFSILSANSTWGYRGQQQNCGKVHSDSIWLEIQRCSKTWLAFWLLSRYWVLWCFEMTFTSHHCHWQQQ